MSQTKNILTDQALEIIVARAFEGSKIMNHHELKEGFCNAAYKIELENGKRVVLKIAPANASHLMSCEMNLMRAEVTAMKVVRENAALLLPSVLYYDASKTICDSEYFFMECLEGYSFSSRKNTMTEASIKTLEIEIGAYLKELHLIKGNHFGLLGSHDTLNDALFPFFEQLLLGILQDAMKKNIDIGVEADKLHGALVRDRACFQEVTEPVLVHWDTWEGNWFVKDDKIIGLIDWERAMYGDPLMEDRFRSHSRSHHFLEGYGVKGFSESENVRLAWYDVYLYLIMMVEGAYRGYETDALYQWAKSQFLPILENQFNV